VSWRRSKAISQRWNQLQLNLSQLNYFQKSIKISIVFEESLTTGITYFFVVDWQQQNITKLFSDAASK